MSEVKIIGVIPARLSSTRFNKKVLYKFFGLEMVEHVRRRGLLSNLNEDVYVASCDNLILKLVENSKGKTIKTGKHHLNGTSRVAEAIQNIDCSHVILLQGDEPLILPSHINKIINMIYKNPEINCWNATSKINNYKDLNEQSIVKCAISKNKYIIDCFRKSPYFCNFATQRNFIRKVLGIIAFRKDFLLNISLLEDTQISKIESIEQMKIIENDFKLKSFDIFPNLPSVNVELDIEAIYNTYKKSKIQKHFLKLIL